MAQAPTPRDPAAITDYHAHVYYRDPAERDRAAWLRAQVEAAFPAVRIGRWRDMPVGPHPAPMFQLAFEAALLPALLPWLMLNRRGLVVLLHPETDNPLADHLRHAAWMGEVLPLDGSGLPGTLEQEPG
ncbi:DOPA 4,5-dioxygenase family protein [Roseomonas sp. OT10]|uniref:DOPA 4,5-dioxygenase family protein n=1 Tax=Roseomonas cutis TaxID=2897332 RepID=UPI001E537F82|nr:DOPA 4,5-dioxygenase family protein [Roseomonas sp. OT10]UFN50442.1 DOPA 4,5-dioxygenase family protein [Roseomonas sp. OT10]